MGQKANTTAITQTISKEESTLTTWLNGASVTDQLTITVYDEKYNPLSPDPGIAAGIDQQNLRNRVSYSMVKALSTDMWHQTATFYTYDIHGNVNQLLQDYRGVANLPSSDRLKTIKYQYDLVSGKVNEVAYQPGAADGFYHRYAYDAENRITDVETSRDGVYWEHEANYEYYKHGPLARMVLGKELQGVDYAYTIQGWLKGVNGSSLTPDKDMGKDGLAVGGVPSVFGRDIYGYALHYFDNGASENDYYSIGGTGAFARPNNGSFKSLYNGNIGAMTVNNGGLKKGNPSTTNSLPLFYNYSYDQLNRIVGMQAYKGLNESTNLWTPISIDDYQEQTSYDPDGNILWYKRNGAPSVFAGKTQMDNMDYLYYPGNNRLRQVTDKPTLTGDYTEDIDDQADPNNYTYDAIGNLKTDVSEGITAINWTVYGKIASVVKSSGTISYAYDASGNRITKTAAGKTTLYIRDAGGNVMSVYEVPALNQIEQKELHLYGSSRLGMALKESRATVTDALATGFDPAKTRTQRRGEKFFELSNHLGNVLATLTDKKLQQGKAAPNDAELDYFMVDVASATDYYPFGMGMPGRKVASEGYRYGFNGQEKSMELDPNGNSMTAEYWQYDARLGRRWNVDPRPNESISSYSALSNSPVFNSDPLGDTTVPQGSWYRSQDWKNVTYKFAIGNEKKYLDKEPQKWWPIPEGSRNRTVKAANGLTSYIDLHPDGTFLVIKTDLTQHAVNGKTKWEVPLYGGGFLYVQGRDYMQSKGVGDGSFWSGAGAIAGDKVVRVGGSFISKIFTKTEGRYVYRALSSANAETVAAGEGVIAKAPQGTWTLEEHLIKGSSKGANVNDPWLATSTDINVARSFSTGNGVIKIDLSKIPKASVQRGWMNLNRSSPGYHYSIWQQEVSIFGQIPQNAIKKVF